MLCSLSNGVKQLNAKSIDVTPLHLSINEYDPLNDFQGLKFRAFEKESLEGRDQNGMIDTSAVCTVQGDIQKATMVFFKKTYLLEALSTLEFMLSQCHLTGSPILVSFCLALAAT